VENKPFLVAPPGVEPQAAAESTAIHVDSSAQASTRVDVSARELVAIGPTDLQGARSPNDAVEGGAPPVVSTLEDALGGAIAKASTAGRWDIVAQLARELEARRLAASGAVNLAAHRNRKT
jgi:hypothetical protein